MKAWGYNGNGRLGNNSTTNSSSPVSVSSISTAVAAAGGADHSLALLSDGTVAGWGSNAEGQLGAPTPTQSLTPMAVANMSGALAIAAGTSFSYALRASGEAAGVLWSFGDGDDGQLGDGTVVSNRKSVAAAIPGVRSLSAGDRHGIAFRQDGRTVSWGADDYGQLGDGAQVALRRNPVHSLGAGELVQVAAGNSFSVALRAEGTIYSWGYGERLGQGSSALKTVPTPIPSFSLAGNSWMAEDTDGDGLSNAAEYRLGSDPLNGDTNQDGIADGDEFQSGSTPTSWDTDGDGLSNTSEAQLGTDPLIADSDGDGTVDGADCYPLDSTRTACGTSNPSDTTPPTITLDEPPGAVPVP
jgi:alpha-tubulin suppressor-like RCC1 family protein